MQCGLMGYRRFICRNARRCAGGFLLAMVGWLLLLGDAPTVVAQTADADSETRQALRQQAATDLWRLKKSIDEDGFYNARIALNVWRSSSLAAGTFDPELYEALKLELYRKSVASSLACYEYFISVGDPHDAGICLQTWRMHAREIGVFDPARYEEMKQGLEAQKKK
jgi:hypothetical protein